MSELVQSATAEQQQALRTTWDEISQMIAQLRDPQNMSEAQLMSDINANIEALIIFCQARAQGVPCRGVQRWMVLTPAGRGFDPLERPLTRAEVGA